MMTWRRRRFGSYHYVFNIETSTAASASRFIVSMTWWVATSDEWRPRRRRAVRYPKIMTKLCKHFPRLTDVGGWWVLNLRINEICIDNETATRVYTTDILQTSIERKLKRIKHQRTVAALVTVDQIDWFALVSSWGINGVAKGYRTWLSQRHDLPAQSAW